MDRGLFQKLQEAGALDSLVMVDENNDSIQPDDQRRVAFSPFYMAQKMQMQKDMMQAIQEGFEQEREANKKGKKRKKPRATPAGVEAARIAHTGPPPTDSAMLLPDHGLAANLCDRQRLALCSNHIA